MGITELPPSWADAEAEMDRADNCVYLPGSDITDHMICQMDYENGVKASLFLCIFGPRADDQETLELVGSTGRLMLFRETGLIDLISDHGSGHQQIDTRTGEFTSSHFGADLELVREMARFAAGAPPKALLRDGYESLRMVTAAQASIDGGGAQVFMKEINGG
jgi:predicted dehydrogenase